MPIAYIKHPVKSEEVKKVMAQYPGYKVRDLKFKPSDMNHDDVVIGDDKPKKAKSASRRSDK